ncbi:MAG: class I SAM-dependent methyltransferase [Ignavibacteriales bacterium]|nr:class I SAM-dependent methyltransferase [Ignavibacteriales bacterium]
MPHPPLGSGLHRGRTDRRGRPRHERRPALIEWSISRQRDTRRPHPVRVAGVPPARFPCTEHACRAESWSALLAGFFLLLLRAVPVAGRPAGAEGRRGGAEPHQGGRQRTCWRCRRRTAVFCGSWWCPPARSGSLEIGGANGYSAIWIGLGLRETGGRLVTIECDPARAKDAEANIRAAGLSDIVQVVPGDAFKAIPGLARHVRLRLPRRLEEGLSALLRSRVSRGWTTAACSSRTTW